MRTMTVIFTTLLFAAAISVAPSADSDPTELVGPPPIYNDDDSHELIGPPVAEDDSKLGGVRCLACHG
ncbi:MAG: hypothetical protein ACJ74T_16610 [Pyrinomonadaceae bacterium]